MEIPKKVRELADSFKDDWEAGHRPAIEKYLEKIPKSFKDLMFGKLLTIELEARRRFREKVDIAEYVQRFPHRKEAIAAVIAERGREAASWSSWMFEPGRLNAAFLLRYTPAETEQIRDLLKRVPNLRFSHQLVRESSALLLPVYSSLLRKMSVDGILWGATRSLMRIYGLLDELPEARHVKAAVEQVVRLVLSGYRKTIGFDPTAAESLSQLVNELRELQRVASKSNARLDQILDAACSLGECFHHASFGNKPQVIAKAAIVMSAAVNAVLILYQQHLAECQDGQLLDTEHREDGFRWLALQIGPEDELTLWITRVPIWYVRLVMDVPLFPKGSPEARKLVEGRLPREERLIDYARFSAEMAVMLQAELDALHDPVVLRFQEFLNQLTGHAAGSADENKELAEKVNNLARQFGIQLFAADKEGTWTPVKIRCATGKGRSLTGSLEAYTPGKKPRTIYSASAWPNLRAGRRSNRQDRDTANSE
jgi:hypothetical protein